MIALTRRRAQAVIALLALAGSAVHACSLTFTTLHEEADRSGLIMIVQIMEVTLRSERDGRDLESPRFAAKFRVVETLKGVPDRVKLLSGGDGSDCGMHLVTGDYYLVLAGESAPVVRVFETRSSRLGYNRPDSSWGLDNARIQALRDHVRGGVPIDRCLDHTIYIPPPGGERHEEFERCKAVISSVLKLPSRDRQD